MKQFRKPGKRQDPKGKRPQALRLRAEWGMWLEREDVVERRGTSSYCSLPIEKPRCRKAR